jgi:hypothetical protein
MTLPYDPSNASLILSIDVSEQPALVGFGKGGDSSPGAALRPMQGTQGMPIGNPYLRSDDRWFSVNALVFGLKTVANF